MEDAAVLDDQDIIDFSRGLSEEQKKKIHPVDCIPAERIWAAQKVFEPELDSLGASNAADVPRACVIYEHDDFPGE